MNWIKKYGLSLLVIFISVFSAVFILEMILRFMKDDSWAVTLEANILRNFEFSYNVSGLYESESQTAHYVRDKYGLRDDCSSPKDIKILTIGGSTTDQRYVSFESTYQKTLQERLRTAIGDFGCVTNAGIDGHSTWGHIFSFEKWFPLIPDLSPSYVLLYVGINDASFERTKNPNGGYDVRGDHDIERRWLEKFELFNRLRPLLKRLKTQLAPQAPYAGHAPRFFTADDYRVRALHEKTKELARANTRAFRGRFERLLAQVKGIGATPICVSQPHRYVRQINGELYGVEGVLGNGFSGLDYDYSLRELNRGMLKLCGELFLDLYNEDFTPEHFYDGVHTTAAGSVFIGNHMADFIIKNNLTARLTSE